MSLEEFRFKKGDSITSVKKINDIIFEAAKTKTNDTDVKNLKDINVMLDEDAFKLAIKTAIILFNENYCLTNYCNKIHIVMRDNKGFSFVKLETFNKLYEPIKIGTGYRKDGTPIHTPIFSIVLNSLGINRAEKGVEFVPNGVSVDGKLNSWTGWHLPSTGNPNSEGVTHLLNFIHSLSESRAATDYMIKWVASMLQKPEKKNGTAIILKGCEGTGKSLFLKLIANIVGRYSLKITKECDLSGKFNSRFENAIFCRIEELDLGRKEIAGLVRDLITGEDYMVEQKGLEAFRAPSFSNFALSTNADLAIIVNASDRRWLIVEPTDTRNREYWTFLAEKCIDNEDVQADFFKYLMSIDLSKFNIKDIPETKEKAAIRNESVESSCSIKSYFLYLSSLSDIELNLIAPDKMSPAGEQYQDYANYCEKAGLKAKQRTPNAFAAMCAKAGFATHRKSSGNMRNMGGAKKFRKSIEKLTGIQNANT